jgi:low temperature requirement protein LtrA
MTEPDELELESEQEVTALELFFDLVFVFAITQVTTFIYHDPTWTRLVQALAILMALWFAWSGYVWLGNLAGSDEGAMRVTLLAAMGGALVASLAVPHAFGRDALAFGLAYLCVRILQLLAIGLVVPREVVVRLAEPALPAAALLVVAALVPEPWRGVCWAAALAVDYGGLVLGGTGGWRVEPGHFAERHRLIVIIALGESIVAVGVGASSIRLDAGVIVGTLLGLAVAASLWWSYFDVVARVAERKLREAEGGERARMARDSFSYLHFPMVAGIVVFAFGVKTTLGDVGARLGAVPAVALCGGVAVYLVAMSLLKRRNVGSYNNPRLVAAGLLALFAPLATRMPALAALAVVAAVTCGLIAYEVWRYAEARDRIRHGTATAS